MDPNAALESLRMDVNDIINGGISPTDIRNLASDIANQFDALDTWLENGGFLPDAWGESHNEF